MTWSLWSRGSVGQLPTMYRPWMLSGNFLEMNEIRLWSNREYLLGHCGMYTREIAALVLINGRLWGDNLFSANHDEWKRHRRIVAPSFTPKTYNSIFYYWCTALNEVLAQVLSCMERDKSSLQGDVYCRRMGQWEKDIRHWYHSAPTQSTLTLAIACEIILESSYHSLHLSSLLAAALDCRCLGSKRRMKKGIYHAEKLSWPSCKQQ